MRIPKIIKNTGLYSVVSFIQKGISFFLLPVYTHYLTVDDYGTLSVIQAIVSFLSIFFLLSLDGSAARFHFLTENINRRARIWGSTLLLVIYNSAIMGAVFILGHKYLLDPFAGEIDFFPLIFLSLLSTILSPLYLFFQRWLQVSQQSKRYSLNLLANFLVLTSTNIISIVVFDMGVYGIVWSTFITSVIFFCYSLFSFIPHVSLKVDKRLTFRSLKYSLPLLPHTISSWLMSMFDRVLINNYLGSSQTGLYNVSFQFGSLIGIVSSSVNQAFSPWFMEKVQANRKELSGVYIFSEIMVIVYCVLAMSLTFFSPEIVRLMTPISYENSWKPIVFISYGYVFGGLYYFLGMPLWLKKTKYVFIITLISAIVGLLLNVILIPILGIIGSGVAMLFSLLVSSALALYLSLKAEPDIKFPWLKLYLIVFISFACSLSIFLVEEMEVSILYKLVVKLAIMLVISILLAAFYKSKLNFFLSILKNKI